MSRTRNTHETHQAQQNIEVYTALPSAVRAAMQHPPGCAAYPKYLQVQTWQVPWIGSLPRLWNNQGNLSCKQQLILASRKRWLKDLLRFPPSTLSTGTRLPGKTSTWAVHRQLVNTDDAAPAVRLPARGFDALLFFGRIGGMVLRLSCNLEALAVGFPWSPCGEVKRWMPPWLDGSVLQTPKLFMERLQLWPFPTLLQLCLRTKARLRWKLGRLDSSGNGFIWVLAARGAQRDHNTMTARV